MFCYILLFTSISPFSTLHVLGVKIYLVCKVACFVCTCSIQLLLLLACLFGGVFCIYVLHAMMLDAFLCFACLCFFFLYLLWQLRTGVKNITQDFALNKLFIKLIFLLFYYKEEKNCFSMVFHNCLWGK